MGSTRPAMRHPLRYAQDLSVGDVIPLGSADLTRDSIIAFATEWDPLPIHTDPIAAADSTFGDVIASGLHILGIYSRLMATEFLRGSAVVAGRGIENLRFRRPARPGDELTAVVRVGEIQLRNGNRADVRLHGIVRNSDDEIVMELTTGLVMVLAPPDLVAELS